MNPFSQAFIDEVVKQARLQKTAEPPPPPGWTSKAWDRHLQKGPKEKTSTGDIDDLEAPPSGAVAPYISRAWGLQKGSSWMDIGPDTAPDRPWRPPGKLKHAGRAENLYRAGYVGLTELAHNPAAHAAARGVVSGVTKGNPVRVAGGLAEGLARSEAGSKLLKAIRKKGKGALESAREAIYPTPQGKLVTASASAGFVDEMRKLGYKLQGHTDVQGIPISIENRKGSVRKGKDGDGKEWRTKMEAPYGYITGTKGADGEGVDTYVGPDKEAPDAYVVHQRDKETGKYDEDKVIFGVQSKKEAKELFLKHYDSPKFLGPISRVPIERLRELVESKRRLVKIAGEREKKLIRRAGPGIGGLVGAGIGAAWGAKRGKFLKGALTGLGTGATLGWVPSMAHEAKKGIEAYRRGK
jgi:hypothetical protein